VRLDHLLSKEHYWQRIVAVQAFLLRGHTFHGRNCSLVERRLFGRHLVNTSSVLPLSLRQITGVEPRASRPGAHQAHCWVLRDRVIDFSGPPSPRTVRVGIRRRQARTRWGRRPYLENYTVDASIFVARQATKGTWWMPWHQEPMKDVGACDKPREVGNRAVIRGFPNGETQLESCPVTSA
jgi:hypothetical protein